MYNTFTVMYVENSAWRGVYLNGKIISQGYPNLEDFDKAVEMLAAIAPIVGFVVRKQIISSNTFRGFGGRFPKEYRSDAGKIISEPIEDSPGIWIIAGYNYEQDAC